MFSFIDVSLFFAPQITQIHKIYFAGYDMNNNLINLCNLW